MNACPWRAGVTERLSHRGVAQGRGWIREPDMLSPLANRKKVEERVSSRFEVSRSFGQFWAMRDGGDGKYGSPGNEESASYRTPDPPVGSTPPSPPQYLLSYQ